MRTLKVTPNNPHDFNNVGELLFESGFYAEENKFENSFYLDEDNQYIENLKADLSELFEAMNMPVNLEIG